VDALLPEHDDETERLRKLVVIRFRRRVRDFRVLIHGADLVLQGSAGSYHLKQLIQEMVLAATTFRLAANQILVDEPKKAETEFFASETYSSQQGV